MLSVAANRSPALTGLAEDSVSQAGAQRQGNVRVSPSQAGGDARLPWPLGAIPPCVRSAPPSFSRVGRAGVGLSAPASCQILLVPWDTSVTNSRQPLPVELAFCKPSKAS